MNLSNFKRKKAGHSKALLFKMQAKDKLIMPQIEKKQVWHDTDHN